MNCKISLIQYERLTAFFFQLWVNLHSDDELDFDLQFWEKELENRSVPEPVLTKVVSLANERVNGVRCLRNLLEENGVLVTS
jgi:hypothetical protein